MNKLEVKEAGDICRFLQELDRTTVTSLTTKSKKKSASCYFLKIFACDGPAKTEK